MTMSDNKASIGSIPSNAGTAGRVGSVADRLSELLAQAIADAAVLEVRTYTNEGGDPSDADPLGADSKSRLRSFTRISLDGDTQVCVPVRADGEPDEKLWRLHQEAVAQARADRAATLESAQAMVRGLTGR